MPQSLRQPEIVEIAKREGKVSVDDLARHFNVAVQTIRRDLADLAASGRLQRVHGGAIPPSGVTNIVYEERRNLNETAKRKIAKLCAGDIPDGTSVFLNIGTTTEAVAQELLGHKNLMVVTNNVNVATILSSNSSCQIVVTGGVFRRADGGLTGDVTVRQVGSYKFDFAVLGCSALDTDGDLLDYDQQEVSVTQAVISRSRNVFVVADHSKFQRHAPVCIGSLANVHNFYSDLPVPEALVRKCKKWRTRLSIV